MPDHGAAWEKVLRKLKAGEMPPAGVHDRPATADIAIEQQRVERIAEEAIEKNVAANEKAVDGHNGALIALLAGTATER